MAKLLNMFGHQDRVSRTLSGEYESGAWSGLASVHWQSLADQLEQSLSDATSPQVRRWARSTIDDLHQMAELEKKREEEERLQWR